MVGFDGWVGGVVVSFKRVSRAIQGRGSDRCPKHVPYYKIYTTGTCRTSKYCYIACQKNISATQLA